jgi:hypothetical protein
VHTSLTKYQKFKTVLPPAPKPEFALPALVNKNKRPAEKQHVVQNPSPLKIQKQSTISFKTTTQKMEEEKLVSGCCQNHRAAISFIADWPEGLICRMGQGKCVLPEDGGHRCSVCPNAYYCKPCYGLQMGMWQSDNDK